MHRGRRARLGKLGAIGIACVVAALAPWPATPASAALNLTPVRTIGGPGHAGLYGWGADTYSDGSVAVSDYWNFRVQHFNTDGSLRRTAVPNNGRHMAIYDVAVDPNDDSIYVTDVDLGRHVDKYSASGNFLGSLSAPGGFNYPAWLDVAEDGTVAVADSRLHKIVVYDDDRNVRYQFGSQGSTTGRFNTPRGIGFDGASNLYVLDNNNRRVQVFQIGTSSATYLRQWSLSGGDYRGLTVNPTDGNIYLVNAALGRVQVYTPTGSSVRQFGRIGEDDGEFVDGGRAITADGDGNLWVGDMPGWRAQKFSPDGDFLVSSPQPVAPPPPGGFNQPGSVAVDSDGDIFVMDTFNWRVQQLDAAGAFESEFGDRRSFNYPRGIAIDPRNGDLVVANTDANSLRKYTQSGQLQWVAQNVKAFAVDVAADGTIFAADMAANRVKAYSSGGSLLRTFGSSLSNPRGIDVDPDGSIWVSSQNTGTVRHYTATGSFLGQIAGGGSINQAMDVETNATHVFVADKSGHRIRTFTKSGASAGSFGAGQLGGPMGLDLWGDRLYVAENGNERVREFRITL